jgi:hypothetical protein
MYVWQIFSAEFSMCEDFSAEFAIRTGSGLNTEGSGFCRLEKLMKQFRLKSGSGSSFTK